MVGVECAEIWWSCPGIYRSLTKHHFASSQLTFAYRLGRNSLVQYYNQYCEETFSTVEGCNQYCGGYSVGGKPSVLWGKPSVLWKDTNNKVEDIKYCAWVPSVMWRDTISKVVDIQYCGWIPSVMWGKPSVLWSDTISTVQEYQQVC